MKIDSWRVTIEDGLVMLYDPNGDSWAINPDEAMLLANKMALAAFDVIKAEVGANDA